jgi:hypothetical protein
MDLKSNWKKWLHNNNSHMSASRICGLTLKQNILIHMNIRKVLLLKICLAFIYQTNSKKRSLI